MIINKHVIIHSAIIIGASALVFLFGLVFHLWGYTGTFIFAGTLISTVYELGSRGHTFSKKKFLMNVVILITALTLCISTISPTTVAGLNITPLVGGGYPPGGGPTEAYASFSIDVDYPSKVDVNEIFEISVTVESTGDKSVTGLAITIFTESPIYALDGTNAGISTNIGILSPNEKRTIDFRMQGTSEDDDVVLSVKVTSTNAGIKISTLHIKVGDSGDNGEPNEPQYNDYPAESQNIFANMFQAVVSNTMTGLTMVFIVLGTILIILGDAQDSKDIYAIGAFAAAVPIALNIFALWFGWVSPSQYFIDLAGPSMASFAQGIVTLVISMLFLNVAFMFDDIIGSAFER